MIDFVRIRTKSDPCEVPADEASSNFLKQLADADAREKADFLPPAVASSEDATTPHPPQTSDPQPIVALAPLQLVSPNSDAPPSSSASLAPLITSSPAPKRPKRRKRRKTYENGVFTPTAAMRRYAEVLASKDCPPTTLERCRRARVSVRRLNLWRRNTEFEEWINNELYSEVGMSAAELWRHLIDYARKGDMQAAKLVTERFSALKARAKAMITNDLARFK